MLSEFAEGVCAGLSVCPGLCLLAMLGMWLYGAWLLHGGEDVD